MDLKEAAKVRFDAIEAELQEISDWMYENPETAYEEHETSAKLAAYLAGNGFDVDYPAYGLDTAFAARAGSHGPEVVICAEYDALPEVGQACGHNIIATSAVGAGVALANLADELGCRITVLGTPAEEHYGGKVDLINAGAFKGVACSMMIHPAPNDILDPGILAVAHIDVEFFGKESHASFAPQVGRNALDAAVHAYVNMSTLRQALYPTDKLHGVITYGGGAPNVIPAYTSMSWYVRAATLERLNELRARVEDCFAAAAQAAGCTHKVKESGHVYEHLESDKVLAELFRENASALGRTMANGSDFPPGASGSTDMGNVSLIVPSIHPMLDIRCSPAVNHQKEFASATTTEHGHRAIRDGALAMAWTIIDVAGNDRWDELGAA